MGVCVSGWLLGVYVLCGVLYLLCVSIVCLCIGLGFGECVHWGPDIGWWWGGDLAILLE